MFFHWRSGGWGASRPFLTDGPNKALTSKGVKLKQHWLTFSHICYPSVRVFFDRFRSKFWHLMHLNLTGCNRTVAVDLHYFITLYTYISLCNFLEVGILFLSLSSLQHYKPQRESVTVQPKGVGVKQCLSILTSTIRCSHCNVLDVSRVELTIQLESYSNSWRKSNWNCR